MLGSEAEIIFGSSSSALIRCIFSEGKVISEIISF